MDMDQLEQINPAEWRVRGQLRHNGVIYGPGEALPVLTVEEARRYQSMGSLIHLTAENDDQRVATMLLRTKDELVLRSLAEQRPNLSVVREMLGLVRANGRSMALRFALEAILFYALGVSVEDQATAGEPVDG